MVDKVLCVSLLADFLCTLTLYNAFLLHEALCACTTLIIMMSCDNDDDDDELSDDYDNAQEITIFSVEACRQ